MNPVVTLIACGIVGYLLGSISNAVLVAKSHGIDIFAIGSGSAGATNVKRSIGSAPGNLVFFLDLLKGFIVSVWPFFPGILKLISTDLDPVILSLTCLTGALLGHSFSIYIGFRGGKGVATAMGGLLAIMAPVVLAGIVVWIIVFYTFRYVSLASIVFAGTLPLFTGILIATDTTAIRDYGAIELWIATGVSILIVLRHHSNISRLLKGTEHKF
jgi:acyl phosphate:glycerol-3-phosphate acyltransferase